VTPTAIEFMDQLSVRASCKYLNEHLPYGRAGAMLLIETDGEDEESVWRGSETVGELCLANGALEVFVADNPTTRQRLWNVRKNVPEAFSVISPVQGREDIVVPPASIPQLLDAIACIAKRHGLIAPCFGHAGDGNVHIWFVKRPADSVPKFRAKLSKALLDLYRSTKALGGTISGEHGIGAKRKRYLRLFLSSAEIALMRKIKRALDPNNIMNPGKIFDV
jgi:glycolate oxidase